jgi:hypothetical protein
LYTESKNPENQKKKNKYFSFHNCKSPLLGLDRHHKAYKLLVDKRLRKFEATSMDEGRFRFRAANCVAITDELGLVDWHGLFLRTGVDLFSDVLWSCFEKSVPRTSTSCAQKGPWETK